MKTKKIKLVLFISIFAVLFTGCGLWLDFTTYFNTYYNAKTLFDRIEEDILIQQKDVFAFREIGTTPQQIKDLTTVIEKCSKILQYKQESSFFNDALFITGKALYYQYEYAGAQRKFMELAGIPETKYELENRLWLARTNLQLRNFEQGLTIINDVKEKAFENRNEKIFNKASITHIAFLVFREEYQTAISEASEFLNKVEDDEMAALINFQLGKLYILTEDKENALKAFAEVSKYAPSFEIQFESSFEYARLLKELGRLDESEKEFDRLRYDGKFRDQQDRVLVEIGDIYYSNGEYQKALDIFKDVDSTYRQKPTSGIASMMIGEIYEDAFGIYDSAYKYYTKTIASLAPTDIKVDATSRVRDLDKYFNLKSVLANHELDLKYINDPTEFIRDSIDYEIAYRQHLEEKRKKEEQNVSLQQRLQQQQFQQTQPPVEQPVAEQTPPESNTFSEGRDGSALVELIAQGKAKKPARPSISPDSIRTLISQNLYNVGNIFYSDLDVPDSAKHYFELILNEYAEKPVYVNAMFALGTYYETNNQEEKADSLFNIIYENHTEHALYSEAGRKLGLIKTEEIVTTDTKDPAEIIYLKAEDLYYDQEFEEAISQFREVYLNHPTSSFAPKAIYFIGLIHEERQQYDSAAFFYGILSTKEYAATPYGKAVVAKYTEYKSEKEKLEKEARAIEEKLNNELEEQKIDDALEENKNDKIEDILEKDIIKELTDPKVVPDSSLNKLLPKEVSEKPRVELKDTLDTKIIDTTTIKTIEPD